jgi:N-acyl homoserine lactone hydrolase
VNYKPFEGWTKGENKVEPFVNDKDVFGDRSVIVLASLERLKKIAANSKATVIIQHDARDVEKLQAFPAAAK